MSDWTFLNQHRIRNGLMRSNDSDGFNGAFILPVNGLNLQVVCSDGLGWQHVSVSIQEAPTCTPSWETMCKVKDLFWEPEDAVIQIHPPKSQYVNLHLGCLHLWKHTGKESQPLPSSLMIGPM